MLSYELCRKLKEAGFMLEKIVIPSGSSFIDASYQELGCKIGDDHYFYPTLSELIEALHSKGQFYSLYLDTPKTFRAHGAKTFKQIEANRHVVATGTTPEEAVAGLYLKLNKTK